MTKQFNKWLSKQEIQKDELNNALKELEAGSFDANLGSNLFKKRFFTLLRTFERIFN